MGPTLSRHRLPERLLVVLLVVALCGCTQRLYTLGAALPADYPPPATGASLASVLRDLGPPLRLAAGETGWIMAWESWRIRELGLGLSLGFLGADVLEFDWGDARVAGDFLVVTLDRNHRVSGVARHTWDSAVGGGRALQPFGGVVSVVDVDDLLLPLPQHGWGAVQLTPLPASLNNAQRPGLGNTGVEQRGTPGGAGQRSLDWPR